MTFKASKQEATATETYRIGSREFRENFAKNDPQESVFESANLIKGQRTLVRDYALGKTTPKFKSLKNVFWGMWSTYLLCSIERIN